VTTQGNEPVRDWLKGFEFEVKKHIGGELMAIQLGWPVGPPLCKKVEGEIWELTAALDNIEYRILFAFYGKSSIVLLHSFIKKTNKTPKRDKELAQKRLAELKSR
jgi:phage-related protein